MTVDYRERKFVNKNRPRRQPIAALALAFVAVAVGSFSLGGVSGWFVCKYKIKSAAVAQPALPIAKDATPQAQQNAPSGAVPKRPEVPLSFFETLPKGANAVIGSGLNPKHDEQQPQMQLKASPATSQQPSSQAALPHASPEQRPAPNPATAPPIPVSKQYTVQVASLRDKSEAESLRKRLAAKGLEVQVIENKVPDKGTWFRVRAGLHLQQAEAQQLAAKIGSGAIAVPE
jgi:cell division septation protein DedD